MLHRQQNSEVVECLSAKDGTRQWAYQYPTQFVCRVEYSSGPYATPVIDGDQVFTLGAEGQLHALRLIDGTVCWRRDLVTEFDASIGLFPMGASPLLEGDALIVSVGGRRPNTGVVAFDRISGKTIWTATNDRRGYATPVAATIHGHRHIFVLTDEALRSLDPTNGQQRWGIPFRPKNPDVVTATTPVVQDELVFASAYQVGAMCIRVLPSGGYEKMWYDRRSLDSQHNNLICRDGCVIGYSAREHVLGSIDLRTGAWQWKWKSELDRGVLVSFSDQLIVLSESGQLAKVTVNRAGCEYAALPLPLLAGPCYSAPAFSGMRMFVRNEKTLVCFQLGPSHPVKAQGSP